MPNTNNFFSTGRGGAGNIRQGDPEQLEQKEGLPGENVPYIKQPIFTTGRGGFGNMRHNDEEGKLARKLQDVDDGEDTRGHELSTVKSPVYNDVAHNGRPSSNNNNYSIGRGGWGNIQETKRNEKKTFMEKAKEVFSRSSSHTCNDKDSKA
ncbi:hypothetical protein NADFUDRAFT_43828 [Nadsonia fulvescens var. elongata DSM 6958]|uniref:Uncharacterized protein n=1 Tax=Nadsonia fulvescens var. elongata DSM 6958 TaxID=857566 RepID=A0A1E3PDQ4_9ASCO|nr:hypothetical protein NADFUDRAFT_43828 [Nadsonia fulvescens var. elongata DSM 6958]